MRKEEALRKYFKGEDMEDLKKEVLTVLDFIKPAANVTQHRGFIFNALQECVDALERKGGKEDQIKEMKKRVSKLRGSNFTKAIEIMSDYCELV